MVDTIDLSSKCHAGFTFVLLRPSSNLAGIEFDFYLTDVGRLSTKNVLNKCEKSLFVT